jgi:hypothetical protein
MRSVGVFSGTQTTPSTWSTTAISSAANSPAGSVIVGYGRRCIRSYQSSTASLRLLDTCPYNRLRTKVLKQSGSATPFCWGQVDGKDTNGSRDRLLAKGQKFSAQ